MLTNGGMETEKSKAKSLNKKLGIDLIKEEHCIMCHTPFGDPEFQEKYNEKIILVACLRGAMIELAENYQFKKYITLDEFSAIYPEISYFVGYEYTEQELAKSKKRVLQRFGVSEENLEDFRMNLKIGVIVIMCWIV